MFRRAAETNETTTWSLEDCALYTVPQYVSHWMFDDLSVLNGDKNQSLFFFQMVRSGHD